MLELEPAVGGGLSQLDQKLRTSGQPRQILQLSFILLSVSD